jgi:hypothetical protein
MARDRGIVRQASGTDLHSGISLHSLFDAERIPMRMSMAIRKKGRAEIEVEGRTFLWYVHDEQFLRIASEDKRFVVSYRWTGSPLLAVNGPEFPGVAATQPRPAFLSPPAFGSTSPGELAHEIVRWALYSAPHNRSGATT